MTLSEINVENRTVYFRDGTSDSVIINANLTSNNPNPEYMFPQMPAKVILDIGANIGITSLLMRFRYPNALIYSFEPETENFSILKKNLSGLDQMVLCPFGLGAENGELNLYKSSDEKNYGGFSVFQEGSGAVHQKAPIVAIQDFLTEAQIDQIDIIKIDCEGAEYDILTAIPQAMMEKIAWIEGECHGQHDFELLAHLQKTHTLAFKKDFHNRNWNFRALNKSQFPVQ